MESRHYAILGIICAVIGFVIFPLFLGIAAILLGYKAIKDGEKALGTISVALGTMILLIIIVPFIAMEYFWGIPLEEKNKDTDTLNDECEKWRLDDCDGLPSDDLCVVSGKIGFITKNSGCEGLDSEEIDYLKNMCCIR